MEEGFCSSFFLNFPHFSDMNIGHFVLLHSSLLKNMLPIIKCENRKIHFKSFNFTYTCSDAKHYLAIHSLLSLSGIHISSTERLCRSKKYSYYKAK